MQSNLPQNDLSGLTGFGGTSPSTGPTPTPVTPSVNPVPNMPTDAQNSVVAPAVEQLAQPVVINEQPVAPEVTVQQTVTVPTPAPVAEVPQPEPVVETVTQAQPVEKPVEQVVPAPQVQETAPVVTPLTVEQPMHTNTANLNVISDIIPEPAPKVEPVASPVEQQVAAPVVDQPVSVAPLGELSQVFQLTPSEVTIPAPTPEPEQNPVMVSTDQFINTPTQNVTNTSVSEQSATKSGKTGGLGRLFVWGFILILGAIAILLGMYFANVLEIPFLDTIFGR